MDAKDHGEHSPDKNSICSLEWIALAIEAARRHKEDEQRETAPPPRPRRVSLVMIDGARR
jgi:hypothetical protein